MTARIPLAVLCTLLAGACADPAGPTSVAPSPRDPGQRYEATITVLSSPDHGPQLCAGLILESMPPQCGGPDVTPWDWATVEGEEAANGTSWGEFHLVGTFDGTTFRLTEPPGPPRRSSAPPRSRFPVPCPDLAGGGDREKTSDEDRDAVITHAREQRDFAGAWLGDGGGTVVLAFTGDLERHERDARERWGGALCVTRLSRTYASLDRAQDALSGAQQEAEAAGVMLLSNGIDEAANMLDVGVLIADDAARAWVDEKVGAGVARVTGVLQPVG